MLKTQLMCQRQAFFEMILTRILGSRPNNRLTNAYL